MTGIVVSRLLTVDQFGAYATMQSITAGLATLATLGLDTFGTIGVARGDEARPTSLSALVSVILSVALYGSAAIAVACLLLAHPIATLSNLTGYFPQLEFALIGLVLTAVVTVQGALLTGFLSFRAIARISIIGSSVALLLSVVLPLRLHVSGAIAAVFAGQLIQLVLNYREIRSAVISPLLSLPQTFSALRGGPVRSQFKSIALPALLGSLMVAPIQTVCLTTVVNVTNDLAQAGVLRILLQWQSVLVFAQTALNQALLPMFSSVAREQHVLIAQTGRATLLSGATATVGAGVVALSWGPLRALYGPVLMTETATAALYYLLASAAFIGVTLPLGQALLATGNVWAGFFTNGIRACLQLALTYYWAQDGAIGFARATAIAYLFHIGVTLAVFGWTTRFSRRLI